MTVHDQRMMIQALLVFVVLWVFAGLTNLLQTLGY